MLIQNKHIEMCRKCLKDYEYDDFDMCKQCFPRKDKIVILPHVEINPRCPLCKVPSQVFCTYQDGYSCADCIIKKQRPKYFFKVTD